MYGRPLHKTDWWAIFHLDLSHASEQCCLDENSKKYTTTSAHKGLLQLPLQWDIVSSRNISEGYGATTGRYSKTGGAD